MELTDRKKQILKIVVDGYVATAEPVSSKAIAEKMPGRISSATIRNELADLVEMGYLEQPHTSAGRVPSPMGYRLYVNELMGEHQLTIQETQRINEALNLKMEELDRVIDRAGKVLSQISDYPVFTAAAPRMRVTVKRYDLLMVEENAFIAVVMTDNSVVKNKLVHVAEPVSDTQIQLLSAVLNSSFVGVSREEMEQSPDSALWQLCGGEKARVDGRMVFQAARQGDAAACRGLDRYLDGLSVGLVNLANVLFPEVICLGGGISAADDDLLLDPLRERFHRGCFDKDNPPKLVKASLGNDAGVVGAALLCDMV